ncbi:hypothetical protein I5U71_19075 [Stenotrophomonas maltophilia]|nr:hypothetical protein [Stenotrophomonas maltophilia]
MIDLSCLSRQDIIAHGFSFAALLETPLEALRWGGSCLSVLKLRGQVTEQAMRRFALGQDFDGIQQLWEGAAHYERAAGYRVSFRLREVFTEALAMANAEQRDQLRLFHLRAVGNALLSLALQRDHQVLFVTSDQLEGDWTHHWLFATACAPDGTWERLTEALRVGIAQTAYGREMEAMLDSAKLERSLGRVFPQAPVGRPRQRL